jgi:hypothetical protein
VSLLSPETLDIFLSPTAVLALSRVGWRRRLRKTRSYAVASGGEALWQGALPALAAALKDFGCGSVRILLSHDFVQYRVLPWREELRGDAEYQALAQLEFASAFGSLAHDWTVCLSDEKPGASCVAAAVPSGLLAALVAQVKAAGGKLDGVQTYLAAATDLWQRRMPGRGDQWLLLHEPGRICVAVKHNSNWCWLRHLKVTADWAQQLPQVVAAEALLAGLEAPSDPIQVFAPSATSEARETLSELGFRVLAPRSGRGFMADRDAVFSPLWLA